VAAVGFDDGFADGQSHAGAVDLHALISSTIKLLEDQRLLEVVDAGTSVGDADGKRRVRCAGFGRDSDGSGGRGIFRGILDQVDQHLLDVSRVHAGVAQIGGYSEIDRVLNEELL
jgi:hypothetical protein